MLFSRRMDNLAPYLFAQLEQKISDKRKSGIDVISLGIGDPDLPTPAYIVEEMQRQVADARNHPYPSNWGLPEFAEAAASFYQRRFGVDIDPAKEFFPILGQRKGLPISAGPSLTRATWLWCPTPATRSTPVAPSWREPRSATCA